MKYNYKESYSLGEKEVVVKEKKFDNRKDARGYLNKRVKEVKAVDKSWKTYYQENGEYFAEKELRKAEHIKLENENKFDIGECNIYYLFTIEAYEDL
ncbi:MULTISPECIES: hypothetical protein [Clostridia]|uniref:hypothetical protein n=1 Tax=Clostridia TaxID=186801 RepID=UPI002A8589D3|nr:hypothetical protein [Peptostreptococcus porci]MDY5098770.1 hypothetical protein [Clostridium sp.]MDY5437435.1 hypothetical protein [Peptostreptococcus porci]